MESVIQNIAKCDLNGKDLITEKEAIKEVQAGGEGNSVFFEQREKNKAIT